jgi:hypothetical protein
VYAFYNLNIQFYEAYVVCLFTARIFYFLLFLMFDSFPSKYSQACANDHPLASTTRQQLPA